MHVAPHAPAFIADKPEVQMSFNLTDRVVDLVREGYDLSIRIGGAVDPNFVAVKLATNRRVVCGTPAYFKKHGKPKTLEDLPAHNCLAFNLQGGQHRGWYFRRNGKLATVRVSGQSRLQRRRIAAPVDVGRARARLALDVGNPARSWRRANW